MIQQVSYLEPALPLLLLFGIVGLCAAWRQSRRGHRPWLLVISIAGILLLSMNIVAWMLSLPLEIWYAADPKPGEPAQAIVILAGAVHPPTLNRPYSVAAQDTYERLEQGVWLFKQWSRLPILVCGGGYEPGESYSETMKRVLESEGIPSDWIWVESSSRSTHENAEYGSKILREHGIARIALVMQANSMIRAAASFRKAGIAVVPAPMRFTELDGRITDVIPNWHAIALNGETLHEVIGLAWYRLRGWI